MKALDFVYVSIITGITSGAVMGVLFLVLVYMHIIPGMYAVIGLALIVGAILLIAPAMELENRSTKDAMRNYMANHRDIGA